MKKTLSFLCICSLIFFAAIVGCGGGSGIQNPASAADSSAISLTLRNFMANVAGKNVAAAKTFLSSRAQTESSIGSLTVWDFGADVNTPGDNASYSFTIPSDGIVQSSEVSAEVRAVWITPDGKRLDLTFSMSKDQGVWYISDFVFSVAETGLYLVSSYYPMHLGDQWKFQNSSNGSTGSIYSYDVTRGPETIGNIANVFTLSDSRFSLASLQHSSIKGALYLFGHNGTNRYSTQNGLWCLGPVADSSYQFNGGNPWQMLPANVSPGKTYFASLTESVNGTSFTIDAQVAVSAVQPYTTLLGTIDALPLDITLTYAGGSKKIKERWYLAGNLGLIGFANESTISGSVFQETGAIQSVKINGVETKPGATPTPTPTPTVTPTPTLTPTVTPTLIPTVTSTNPANGASGVAVTSNITANFSGVMDPSTINTATFIVTGPGGTSVSGTVSYGGQTANFTPISNLAFGTTYTATITTGSKNLTGNALAANYTWSFTSVPAPKLMSVRATQDIITPNQINVSFYDASGTQLTTSGFVAGGAPLSPTNFSFVESFDLKTGTNGPTTYAVVATPTSWSVGGTSGKDILLKFASGTLPLGSPNWNIIASGVLSQVGGYTSDPAPTLVGNHVRAMKFIPWTDFGTGTPVKITAPVSGELYLVYKDRVLKSTMSETVTSGVTNLTVQTGGLPTWFSGISSGTEIRDMFRMGNPNTGAFLAFNALLASSSSAATAIASQSDNTIPYNIERSLGAMNGLFFDYFPYSSGPDMLTIAATTGNLTSVPWINPGAATSTIVGANVLAMDSFGDPSQIAVPQGIRFINQNGQLNSATINASGTLVLGTTAFTFPAGFNGPNQFGLVWLASWLDQVQNPNAVDQYLVADASYNTIHYMDKGVLLNTSQPIWNIGGNGTNSNITYKGWLNRPYSVCVYDSKGTAVTDKDLWILVADSDGLTIYRDLP
ncbi:MAG: Ig-like domain-containing protein [Candidatus Riflebacteria bacterium]|nr:Ig-like domain-containing protein [Candidatus Riflebacteria bacterium]